MTVNIASLKSLLEQNYKSALEKKPEGHRYTNRFYVAFTAINLIPVNGTEEERRAKFEGAYRLILNGKDIKNVPAQDGRGSIHDYLGTIKGSYDEKDGWYLKLGSEDAKRMDSVVASVNYSGGKGLTSMGVSLYASLTITDHWKEDNRRNQNLDTTLTTEEVSEVDDEKIGYIKDRLRPDSIKIYIYNGDKVTDTNSESSLMHIWNYFNYNKDSYLVTIAGNTDGAAILDNLLLGIDGSAGAMSTSLNTFSSNSEKQRVVDFILSKTAKQERNTDWFLLEDEIVYTLKYDDTEHDLPLNFGDSRGEHEISPDSILADIWNVVLESVNTEEKILTEKWRYRHNPEFYDNSMGVVPFNNSWIDTSMRTLDKVGLYRINYKRRDNPLYPDRNLQHTFNNYRYWSEDYDSK